ncbi:hypothetical protein LXM25_16750 [Dyadobacter sp. LJ53]|uniref:hypothetical protein n=1 Tax=Dyadobacter chenwenxiniae TaxID=2906456 RepID=UPI001F3F7633|nr:hypothetical protein [Dyadobacter chenwenxiniae]MCF0051718.1 hypothetical protein [Dyadobacter chenwenxiniae]
MTVIITSLCAATSVRFVYSKDIEEDIIAEIFGNFGDNESSKRSKPLLVPVSSAPSETAAATILAESKIKRFYSTFKSIMSS